MRKLTPLIILLLLHTNCLEKFDFERPDSIQGAVSIQGKLVKGNPSRIEVTMRDVFDFFNTPKFLAASKVYLINEEGERLALQTRRQGFFTLEIPNDHPTFKIAYGRKYKIRIENLKGKTLESDFDELFPAPVPSKLVAQPTTLEFINRLGEATVFDQLSFYISTPLKAENQTINSRLLWEMDGIAKVTDTPNSGGRCSIPKDPEAKICYASYAPFKNYLTFNGAAASGDQIDNILVNEANYTNLFAEGYYLIVYQQSVSEGAFDYWSQVGAVVNRQGNVFEAPAGTIATNIKNIDDPDDKIYGFFYATEEHPIRVYVSPQLGRNPDRQCPLILMDGSQADFCCDCLTLKNSTTIKPDWWEE